MGELDALELHLFAQGNVDETVLNLHRQAVREARDAALAEVEAAVEAEYAKWQTPDDEDEEWCLSFGAVATVIRALRSGGAG